MKHKSLLYHLMLGTVVTLTAGIFASCEQEFYQDEQYRKEIYLVSGEDNIFQQEFSFGEEATGYLSVYAGGTTPIEKQVTVELGVDEMALQEYNQKRYGTSYDQYALELPEERYIIADWSVQLTPDEKTPYSLFPIKVDVDGLEPEDTYFLPLRIASVSDYMISETKRNVLLQILVKNDYATTKTKTYYSMKGTKQKVEKDTWKPIQDVEAIGSGGKEVAPVAARGVRLLPDISTTSDRTQLRKQGIVATVHPEEIVEADVIGDDGLPTGEKIQCQKVTLDNWYDMDGCITVLDIEESPSYYNAEKKEFTLNYRYNYNSGDWYEIHEVMSLTSLAE